MKLKVILAAAFVFVAFERPAHAYIDVNNGSMLLQALMGGVAGLLVMGRIYWKKIKDYFKERP